ncbi:MULTISPECIES: hypothetical protein [Pseudomonas]|uniref:hypothetical protein n=1 Tax=Pseudomonas TaxID=286 RepID=UPI0010F114B9|nr:MULTISPECIES: hypothetical protein [unclassified Pseudomonas]TCT94775.1 hypothetical protein EC913_11133 [Pseudomonas sp. LP_4_YM]
MKYWRPWQHTCGVAAGPLALITGELLPGFALPSEHGQPQFKGQYRRNSPRR